jgi:hypothetical protein
MLRFIDPSLPPTRGPVLPFGELEPRDRSIWAFDFLSKLKVKRIMSNGPGSLPPRRTSLSLTVRAPGLDFG